MRTLVLVICLAVGACGWTKKTGGGTNYDPARTEIEKQRL